MANNGHGLGFEAKLWLTADKLRNNVDAAEYKHAFCGCREKREIWKETINLIKKETLTN